MAFIRLKFEDGVFVPLDPVPSIEDGDVLEFKLPDPNTVYLCETDRLAALDQGHVIWTHGDEGAAYDA